MFFPRKSIIVSFYGLAERLKSCKPTSNANDTFPNSLQKSIIDVSSKYHTALFILTPISHQGHPDLHNGKGQVTLHIAISPHLSSPVGEGMVTLDYLITSGLSIILQLDHQWSSVFGVNCITSLWQKRSKLHHQSMTETE